MSIYMATERSGTCYATTTSAAASAARQPIGSYSDYGKTNVVSSSKDDDSSINNMRTSGISRITSSATGRSCWDTSRAVLRRWIPGCVRSS
ncbi:hypothetical protein V6N12_033085 [Hibiscus sabdariffa]|uniref:Uncharacterized protein n=1 Tax=Hibiscus sabdariffa TaxID=183260 RepID=A0ABR2BCJ4_9ROSI